MAKNSQEYWAERARQDKVKVIKTGEQGINNLKRLLLLNLKDVESKINDFYDKYGDTPAEYMTHKDWEKYKARLKKLAERYPDDKFLQKIAKQNVPKYQIDRLKALELDLQMQLTEATSGQEQGIYKTLNDVSKVSQATLAKRMKQTLGLTFNSIADRKMKQILMSDWSGSNWSDRLWVDRAIVGKKVTEILEKGVVQGTSLQKMARELKQATNQSFNNAFRLIRTETSHIDGQVTLEGYKQASEELGLEYYEYDAFLDSRTSSICRELDKKRFKVSEAEVGVNYPPMHPNCRSTTQLVLDEDYKQKESPKEEKTGFKEAKTLQEAKDYANRFVKNGQSSFDNKITLENLNTFNERMTYLTDKYQYNEYETVGSWSSRGKNKPLAHANSKLIEIESTYGASTKADFEKMFADAVTNYQKPRLEAIEKYSAYLGDSKYNQKKIKKYIKEWQEEAKYTRFTVQSSAENHFKDTVTHEFGHSLFYRAMKRDLEQGGKIFINNKERYKLTEYETKAYKAVNEARRLARGNGDIYKISKYANTDIHEFFAECFTIYEGGVEKLPDYINNMVIEVVGK